MNAKIGLIYIDIVTWIFNCLHLFYLHVFRTGTFATDKHEAAASQTLISHAPFRRALNVPFTVRETSFSAAPTRGTTARHTYFPASSCLTDFRVRMFSLLSTCSQSSKINTLKGTQKERARVKTNQDSWMGS